MTRYTRGTKSTTHQRGNPGTATPWSEFQAANEAATPKPRKNDTNSTAGAASGGGPKLVKIFGQFWVPQEDAKRFQKLIVKLKAEGLSRKAISDSLRNEIRRAEKKARRSKDKTCFNCRQYGHLLADCPNAPAAADGADNALVGPSDGGEICFKCGSTEHTSRKCVKNKDNENYNFAKCFICQATGHISRQCPDNQRGIFPSGGTCNDCGDTGHLAKDCTKTVKPPEQEGKVQQQEDAGVTVSAVMDPKMSTEYEAVDEDWQKKVQQSISSKSRKLISNLMSISKGGGTSGGPAKKRRVKF
jgi:zinc finger CCHC domain-containing protein 9